MYVYSIITSNDIISHEKLEARKSDSYRKINKKIKETLGSPGISRIYVPRSLSHIEVLAENEDDAMKTISENRENIEKVYAFFGIKVDNYKVWGSRCPGRYRKKRTLLGKIKFVNEVGNIPLSVDIIAHLKERGFDS